jgi:Helix-turn-helix domain
MPRRPSPVDPTHGPAARFACELRRLRDDAGTPTYRALAEQTHFSKATLAAAAGGHRLPTLDVTLAFAQACGGDIDEWRKRWSQARTELGAAEPPAPSDEVRVAPAAHRRCRPRARLLVGLAAIGITASVVGVLTVGGNNDATRHAPVASPSSVRSAAVLRAFRAQRRTGSAVGG